MASLWLFWPGMELFGRFSWKFGTKIEETWPLKVVPKEGSTLKLQNIYPCQEIKCERGDLRLTIGSCHQATHADSSRGNKMDHTRELLHHLKYFLSSLKFLRPFEVRALPHRLQV